MLGEITSENSETVSFYNVENLLLPVTGKEQIRGGLKNWNLSRYSNKLHKIAHVFEIIKENKGSLPFIIGLGEIQGAKPLNELLALPPFNGDYGVVHYKSMDERGVDVAMLYDKRRVEVLASEPISFFFEIADNDPENYDTTRDVLFCKVKFKSKIINVFVLHLPSKRDLDVNKPKRSYILKEIKERINILLKSEESVIVMGDFNENPDDENLTALLSSDFGRKLFNPFLELFRNKNYSTYHQRFGLLFDQIIMSDDFITGKSGLQFRSAEVFNDLKISNWDRKFRGRPFRTYAGTRYLGGYSDHFPVLVQFK